jgi:hypothetical protein
VEITRFTLEDFQEFWPIFKRIVGAQNAVAIDPRISYDEAFETWCLEPEFAFVSRSHGQITGSYYLKANASGPGSHVCNCTYMVDDRLPDQGVTRLLCQHSQQVALNAGFQAMQFNSVVATDQPRIMLWKDLGFRIIGAIPQGYRHKYLGLVDVYIMYKQLVRSAVGV